MFARWFYGLLGYPMVGPFLIALLHEVAWPVAIVVVTYIVMRAMWWRK